MLWVDQESYFGPDRRRKSGGLRLRERRRYDAACNPPSMHKALRQLRMRVIDARGDAADAFVSRANAVATLAELHGEAEAAHAITNLSMTAARGRYADVRPSLYNALDHVQSVLRA